MTDEERWLDKIDDALDEGKITEDQVNELENILIVAAGDHGNMSRGDHRKMREAFRAAKKANR